MDLNPYLYQLFSYPVQIHNINCSYYLALIGIPHKVYLDLFIVFYANFHEIRRRVSVAPSKQNLNELLIIFLQKYECSGHSYD